MKAASAERVDQPKSTRETVAFLLDYAPKNWCSREDYHVRLCEALSAAGVRSVLVFAKQLPDELARALQQKGVHTATIDYGKGVFHYYRELGKLVRKYSVTAVHICYFDYFSAIAWMAHRHGVRTIIYEAVNSGFFSARSWKKALLNLRTQLMTKPLTRVIAISDFVKRQLVDSGVSSEKIDVRHLGVDNKRCSPAPDARQALAKDYLIDKDEVVVSTVSFLNPFKNPHTIVEACGLLASEGVRFRLFVAGEGPLRTELESLSRRIGIAGRVHWLGHVGDPGRLLQGSDIFALASVGEAFGLVLTEAMACGLPVVATQSGGIVEIVEDGETGFLVSALNSEAFAAALRRLIEDAHLREDMGDRGRARVAEMFTVNRVVSRTMEIYKSMNLVRGDSSTQENCSWEEGSSS